MRSIQNAPVAVLDSGIGGVGVLRALRQQLPREDFFYFGDGANAPYGDRTHADILALVTAHAARLLEKQKCKALVLACNTATAVAANVLRATYPKTPIIGMEPALRPALTVCDHPCVLVLATAATLKEEKFAALLARCRGSAEIVPLAAPALVRLVEAGEWDGAKTRAYLSELLAPFAGIRFDAAVLGCTHFPFAARAIGDVLGGVPLFDGADGTARETARRLAAAGLLHTAPHAGRIAFASSDPRGAARYRIIYQKITGENVS